MLSCIKVLAVFNDGDLGVYKHEENADGIVPTKANIDKRHEKSTSAGGNQRINLELKIEETFGDYYYCYVLCHSLTDEKQSIISFSSDEIADNLRFLYWCKYELIVIDTGKSIFLIDSQLKIKASFDITTPLIGMYLTNNLVLLEEASFRLINSEGEILKTERFDLIETFNIDGSQLHIQTSEESKLLEL